MTDYTIRKPGDDGNDDIDIGIEDLNGTIHLPSQGAVDYALNGIISGDTVTDGLAYVLTGRNAVRGPAIYLLDADMGVRVPRTSDFTLNTGITVASSEGHILGYQGAAPLYKAEGEEITKAELKEVLSELKEIRLGKMLKSFENMTEPGEDGQRRRIRVNVSQIIDSLTGQGLSDLSDGTKTGINIIDKFNRGDDGAMVFVDPNGTHSTFLAYTSETGSPDWNYYLAKKNEDSITVNAATFSQQDGQFSVEAYSVDINDTGLGLITQHPASKQVVHLSAFSTIKDGKRTAYDITRTQQGSLEIHLKTDGYSATYDSEGNLLSHEGELPADKRQLDMRRFAEEGEETLKNAIAKTRQILRESGLNTKIEQAIARTRDAANGADLTGQPNDDVLTADEFVNLQRDLPTGQTKPGTPNR